MKKEKATTTNMKITEGKNLTVKAKYTIKVVKSVMYKASRKVKRQNRKIIYIHNK